MRSLPTTTCVLLMLSSALHAAGARPDPPRMPLNTVTVLGVATVSDWMPEAELHAKLTHDALASATASLKAWNAIMGPKFWLLQTFEEVDKTIEHRPGGHARGSLKIRVMMEFNQRFDMESLLKRFDEGG